MSCRLHRRHVWRTIHNEYGPCLYCSRCGSERHESESSPGEYYVKRPPGPSWPVRDVSVMVGARIPRALLNYLRRAFDHVELGAWLRAHGQPAGVGLDGRDRVHDVAIDWAVGKGRVLYLELGVFRGTSLRYWSERVTDPDARFVGFDSFLGLPEAWHETAQRGCFSTGGVMPRFADGRVSLVPGWFEDTLNHYELPEHDVLVVNIDCDLYSSTRTALGALESQLRPGCLILLDELNDADNELRAFDEFLSRTGYAFEVLARSRSWAHWLVILRQPSFP